MNMEEIRSIAVDDADKLAALDAQGFFAAPGEDLEHYKARIISILSDLEAFNGELVSEGGAEIISSIKVSPKGRINPEILEESAEITSAAYDFIISWVPGFFPEKSIGPLWGGCAISFDESQLSVFIIRADFAKKNKWLFYRRDELLSHELCHIARMPLDDKLFEEFFAYRLSPSAFRRYFGSCFRTQADSLLFIFPIFLLLAVQIVESLGLLRIPVMPFWILSGLFPAFLIARNIHVRATAYRAARILKSYGIEKAFSVLFRCTSEEISEISKFQSKAEFSAYADRKAAKEVRWIVIRHRFC